MKKRNTEEVIYNIKRDSDQPQRIVKKKKEKKRKCQVHIRRLLLLLYRFSRVRLCDPIDGIPPGSLIPGILQARTLEWVAISFSNA